MLTTDKYASETLTDDDVLGFKTFVSNGATWNGGAQTGGKTDMVNSPPHYKMNPYGIECIDAIRAQLNDEEFIGYLRGNVAKYNWRLRYKGKPTEDAEKMAWYQNRLIKALEELENTKANIGYGDYDDDRR